MKRLVDMNLSPRWVAFLTTAGLQASHWSSIGPSDTPDTAIMTYANDGQFVVMTHDLDFSAILAATNGDGPSVLQIRADDTSPEVMGNQVVNAVRQFTAELSQGALITIDTHRARIRLLPFLSDE
ncbi:MAG: DUF5615 family PIN-like protein [Hyphomicrobiaceae bacterium]